MTSFTSRFDPSGADAEGGVLHLAGEATVEALAGSWRPLRRVFARETVAVVDCSELTGVDDGGAALLGALQAESQASGGEPGARWRGLDGELSERIERYRPHCRPELSAARRAPRERLRAVASTAWLATRDALGFIGGVVAGCGQVIRRPRALPWGGLPRLFERAAADALPITLLIAFLTGVILALQSILQLRAYGIERYVVDMVTLATVRELGPLMTAMVVAGRSGSGFAAELGSMRVGDQIEVLRVNGMPPIPQLVLPRILALTLAVPALVVFADLAGVLGGFLVTHLSLDMSIQAFAARTLLVVAPGDVLGGLGKALAYGLAIGAIGCQRGLMVRGGAQGVGRAATSAVVASLFAVIVIDAVLTAWISGGGW